MGFQNIEKNDWFYNFLKNVVGFTHNNIFYKKVYVLNSDKIPRDTPIIFTPNHQNALMDALGPLCNIDKQLVFLARSDIFKKKAVAAILYFLKILPVFRIRDGFSSVKRNKEIFQKTIEVIQARNGLVILPEGNHEGIHSLRRLKKGFARIAFQTEEASDFSLNINIVPIGIHYTDYSKSRSELYLNFGELIPVSDYNAIYKKSPAVAINKLTDKLYNRIKPLMVHISSIDDYDVYNSLRVLYWEKIFKKDQKTLRKNRIAAEQEVIRQVEDIEKRVPETFHEICRLDRSYRTQLKDCKLNSESITKPKTSLHLLINTIALVLGLPLFLYGLAVNLIPATIVKYAELKIKDDQFKSSFKFVVSLIVFPLIYLIESAIFYFISGSFIIGTLLTISLPLTGLFAHFYYSSFNRIKQYYKVVWLKKTQQAIYHEIIKTKTTLDQLLSKLID